MTDAEKIVEDIKQINNAYMVVEEPIFCDIYGVRIRAWFENGLGVSIVQQVGSYGYDKVLWEIAVLVGNEDGYDLCYDTEITDDVIGNLTVAEAVTVARNISRLEA